MAVLAAALVFANGCGREWISPDSSRTDGLPAGAPDSTRGESSMLVTATAFNSTSGQTDASPALTATGARLRPGMRVIAVSDDLYALGLREGTLVSIEGLPGQWRVEDKMAPRWRRKIDVYLGVDEDAARRFGHREVTIRWRRAPTDPPPRDPAGPP